ncbi:MAG: hypothetical protein HONBIEJF_01185 [Fimbriimonadaceae bacterium]|nr:hypothetical protein [Fimbriimonadaceae bacterium]
MVTCSCGKVIDRVPSWLNRVQVEFICNNCPNRTTKNITQMTFTTFPTNAESDAMSSKLDVDEVEEAETPAEDEAVAEAVAEG